MIYFWSLNIALIIVPYHMSNDIVNAWYDDAFYIAIVIESDSVNQLFTLYFINDGMEVDSYKPCRMKHLE